MILQRTLKNTVHLTGIGVHLGEPVHLTLHPASIDTGIIFCRTDLANSPEIPARSTFISNTDLCTCLEKKEIRIATVEHLLSVFSALNIDNCYVDISSSELPIMDGSAEPFILLIQSAGIVEQNALKKFIRIKKSIEIMIDNKFAKLEPYHGFRVSYEIAYDHPVIIKTQQAMTLDFTISNYIKDISRARTFGFLKDYDMLREKNLARGASLENTVVLDSEKVLNESGLRYPDEFVKHKILDVIGDLYLLGHNIIGAFSGYKSGHAMNSALMHELLSQKDTWEIVTFDDTKNAPSCYAYV